MTLEYPSDREFEKLINDYIGLANMQEHLKYEHNLLFCTNRSDTIAERSSKFLFGFSDLKYIQEEAYDSERKKKASAFKLRTELTHRMLASELKELQRTGERFGNKNVQVQDVNVEDDEIELEFDYIVEKVGRTQALDQRHKTAEVTLFQTSEDTSTAFQEYEMVNEDRAVGEFLTGWNRKRRDEDKEPIQREDITLSNLHQRERVELAEELIRQNLDRWRREDVGGLDVRRDEEVQEEPVPELEGIREAAFEGSHLDTNDIINKAKENGYYFTLVKVKYQHKTDAKQVVIKIEFKEGHRETFEVSIVEEQEEVDGSQQAANFGFQERKRIRNEFRESVIEKYNEYRPDGGLR